MTKDEALRLALEALKETWYHVGTFSPTDEAIELYDKAITAIKEALETKDEPVAWMNRHGACKTSLFMEVEAGAKEEYTIPLYTTPQRTWVGLTDDEFNELYNKYVPEYCSLLLIEKVEAKLKEKNT